MLVLPKCLVDEALNYVHCKESAHLGIRKTITKAESLFYWSNLRRDVAQFVTTCVTCQRYKEARTCQKPWQKFPGVTQPLDRISCDLVDLKTPSSGFRYVLTILDQFSRFVRMYPLKTKTAEEVTEGWLEYVDCYGAPKVALTDNVGEFTAKSFRDACQSKGTDLVFTTPYHPLGNGAVERAHRTIKSMLATLCNGQPQRWSLHLRTCQDVLNKAVHTTIGTMPYYAFFACHPPRLVPANLPQVEPDNRDNSIRVAREAIQAHSREMGQRFRDAANYGRQECDT